MQIHAVNENNLKFSCQVCSAQYGRRFALKDHMNSEHPGVEITDEEEHYVIEETQSEEAVDEEVYSVEIEADEDD